MRKVIVGVLLCSMTLVGFDYMAIREIMSEPEPQEVVQVEEPVTMAQQIAMDKVKPEVITVTEVVEVERKVETVLTDEEKRIIAGVVWCEAGNQDMIGKRLVADTVLNRVGRPGFAPTVAGVVYQPWQYAYGGYYDDACLQAVEMECYGRLDYDVLWFRTGWYHPYGVPAYQHGDHYFSWAVSDEQNI